MKLTPTMEVGDMVERNGKIEVVTEIIEVGFYTLYGALESWDYLTSYTWSDELKRWVER